RHASGCAQHRPLPLPAPPARHGARAHRRGAPLPAQRSADPRV
ncbi:MAG: hypothetical protein AVDCRST_MAG05-3220, partial [uncultured Rubrobacteraceae bacterium]